MVFWPVTAFVIGCARVMRDWRADGEYRRAMQEIFTKVRAHLASRFIAGATFLAGGILALAALHMIGE